MTTATGSKRTAKLAPRKAAKKTVSRKTRYTVTQYLKRYLAARNVSPMYANIMRAHIRCFVEWAGDVPIAKIGSDLVNEWLEALLATELSANTIRTYSRDLCAVCRDAYIQGDSQEPLLRVKKIKIPKQVVQCYTHEEIGKLVLAARSREGYLKNGIKRADFWEALILSAYATGLRKGDLIAVQRNQIGKDGRAVVIQHKTGYPTVVRFPEEVLAVIDRMQSACGRALPWPYRSDSLTTRFRVIARVSGVKRGSLCWLRRSAGSYAEKMQPGSGKRLLGHRSEWVFRDHYHDQSVAPPEMVEPPALAAPAIAS